MGTLVRNNRGVLPALSSVFDDFLTKDLLSWPFKGMELESASVPAVNVKETDDAYELEVAAPGMSRDDFNVELDNNLLVVSAKKEDKHEEQDDKGNFTRREFNYTSFTRTFALPERLVKGDEIKAKYNDGILYISVPKTEEAKVKHQAKRIEIS